MDEVEELIGQGLDAMFEAFYAGNEEASIVFGKESVVLEGLQETKKDDNSDDDDKNKNKNETLQERFSTRRRFAWNACKIPAFFFSTKNSSSHSTKPNTAIILQGRMSRQTMYDGISCTDSLHLC
jgi:hypothetical protein